MDVHKLVEPDALAAVCIRRREAVFLRPQLGLRLQQVRHRVRHVALRLERLPVTLARIVVLAYAMRISFPHGVSKHVTLSLPGR